MKRLVNAFLVALLLVATVSATALADPKPPGSGGGGDDGRDSLPITIVVE